MFVWIIRTSFPVIGWRAIILLFSLEERKNVYASFLKSFLPSHLKTPIYIQPMDTDTVKQIQNAVSIIFPSLFPSIQCQTPYLDPDNKKLHIPFLWHEYPHREGKMVYDILSTKSITLDAFSCSPLASLECRNGIDWIQLKYITMPPEIARLEKALLGIQGLSICDTILTNGRQ